MLRFLVERPRGIPGELALLVIGPDLLGLCKGGGEAIVALVPEGGIIVRPEFFIE